MCRLNSTCSDSEFPSALVSCLLLSSFKIHASQRISILSAPALMGTSNTDQEEAGVLSLLKYADISSIVRASDEPRRPFQSQARSYGAMNSFSSYRPNNDGGQLAKHRQRLTLEQIEDLKSKSTRNKCKMRGHWARDSLCGQTKTTLQNPVPRPRLLVLLCYRRVLHSSIWPQLAHLSPLMRLRAP